MNVQDQLRIVIEQQVKFLQSLLTSLDSIQEYNDSVSAEYVEFRVRLSHHPTSQRSGEN